MTVTPRPLCTVRAGDDLEQNVRSSLAGRLLVPRGVA